MNLKDAKRGAIGLIISGMLVLPSVVKAQDSPLQNPLPVSRLPGLSLQQAQRRAADHYPGIQRAVLQIAEQKVLKKTAWDLGNTTVYTGKEEFGNGMPGIETTVALKQGPVDVFGIAPALKLQKERTVLAQHALQLTKLQVQQQVSLAWAQAYAAKKVYHSYQRLDSLFDGIRRAAAIRLEVEDISKLEYLALKNQANSLRVDKDQAYADYLDALQQFNAWLTTDTLYGVAGDAEPQGDVPLLMESDSISIKGHPRLQWSRQRIAVAGARVRKRKSAYWPKLQGEFGWQEMDGRSGFYSYQLGVSVPLFAGPQRGRTQSAVIAHKMAEVQFSQDQLQFHARYKQAITRYWKWKSAWDYYRDEGLPLAQKQKTGAVIAYREGDIDYVTFLQNIKNAIEVDIAAWKTFRQYLESRYRLNYYLNQNPK